ESLFTEKDAQDSIKNMRSTYLTLFGKFLRFSRNFTQTLNEPDLFFGSIFVKHAQNIQKIVTALTPTLAKNLSNLEKAKLLQTIKTVNPQLFFYEGEVPSILK